MYNLTDNVSIGTPSSDPKVKLNVGDGIIRAFRNAGNQPRLKTSTKRWDLDVTAGIVQPLRIRNTTASTVPFLVTTSDNVGIGQ